jgi:non-heme chloroperoxidase
LRSSRRESARAASSLRENITMAFIKAKDGTQLYWRDWGRGTPLLFLNSLGLGTEMWDYQLTAFAEQGFRCIGLDRRGHGRSEQAAAGYDHDTFADDVATLIEELNLSGLTLIGHSAAGGEMIRYLSRHGTRRVTGLVLVSPMTPMLLEAEGNPTGLPRAAFEALWTQWKSDFPKWIIDSTPPFFVPESSPAMMRWFSGLLLKMSLPVALACARSMVEEDFRDEMRRLEVPTLLIHGDRDRSAPIEATGIPSAALLPKCRFVVYEGAPHGLIYTHAERFSADVLRFVRELR